MINEFPEELDLDIYRQLHPDLIKARLNKAELRTHFENHGKKEGRISNRIKTRVEFIDLIPKTASTLEIGPFFSPVIRGENVKYFDVLNYEQMVTRAKEIGQNEENIKKIPHIDYFDPEGNLDVITEQFDVVISSHNIEHQPDLILHFQKIEKLLKPGGLFFLMIPDKRYCFDHFNHTTTIADIISKHALKVKVHSLKSVIEHLCLTTHNEAVRHWNGDHGKRYIEQRNNVNEAIQIYENAHGGYVDVHASYFTPDSFAEIAKWLKELKLTNLKIIRNYHTRRYQLEFLVIMQNGD